MWAAIKNLGISGSFALLTWAGYLHGIEGARNVTAFITWLVFLPVSAMAAAAISSKGVRDKMRPTVKPARVGPVVRWTNTALALACVAVMVWSAAFVTGAALFLAWACSAYTTKTLRQLRDERTAQECQEAA